MSEITDEMVEIAGAELAKWLSGAVESGYCRSIARDALYALDAAGYQIVQKPLELTSDMAALCQEEGLVVTDAASFQSSDLAFIGL